MFGNNFDFNLFILGNLNFVIFGNNFNFRFKYIM